MRAFDWARGPGPHVAAATLYIVLTMACLGGCDAAKFAMAAKDRFIMAGLAGCTFFTIGLAGLQYYRISRGQRKTDLADHFKTVVEIPFIGNTGAHRDPRFRTNQSDQARVDQEERIRDFYDLFPEDIRRYLKPAPQPQDDTPSEPAPPRPPAKEGTIMWYIENDASVKGVREWLARSQK